LPALHSTVGKNKVEVVAERILDINPEVNLSRLMNFIARKNGRNAGKQ
jgi:tRNA A37 threonylcarbamoyladenosine dehydratase